MHPFLKGFIYAMRGLVDGIRTQRNMRFHLAVMSLVIAGGIFFGVSHVEWLVLGLCIAIVIGMELMNTAIEYLTDLTSPDIHPLAGKAKDAAAAAVLWVSLFAALVGLKIFWPYFSRLIS